VLGQLARRDVRCILQPRHTGQSQHFLRPEKLMNGVQAARATISLALRTR
jgi:hypothetical protein